MSAYTSLIKSLKYVNLVLKTLDPDDYYDLEFQQDDGWQSIRIEVWDRVLH